MNNKIKLALAFAMVVHVATRPLLAEDECVIVDGPDSGCGSQCGSSGAYWSWVTYDCGGGIGGLALDGCSCFGN